MEDIQKALAERVRQLRKRAKFTQEALAERAELSIQHISDLERGRGNPTLQSLERLATALDVRLWDLIEVGEYVMGEEELEEEVVLLFRRLDRAKKIAAVRVLKAVFEK
ncbi:helix-turn-helix domain-containing protein [Desulfocurvibacter africanus]|uniref:helix-turn-helix domain-containing protein n=1 Tax=Desulfocurvibacter africanus TaxID=873 RepID=UPI0006880139|nr:helix-turn-helix transcriptional regulator [Desulfocurvibacter africanus]